MNTGNEMYYLQLTREWLAFDISVKFINPKLNQERCKEMNGN